MGRAAELADHLERHGVRAETHYGRVVAWMPGDESRAVAVVPRWRSPLRKDGMGRPGPLRVWVWRHGGYGGRFARADTGRAAVNVAAYLASW